ncbi:MAG: hypothetical protein MUQ05_01990 [Schleiferiaceae bacterium]|jgi:D-alanine-D-alanine ligase|nr:hypothetical protein [Flavobacteriales bacterium]MDG1005269.1 hypothetical protein [Schleiferiaceae bacterium]MBT3677381.1 hypothetical protein [Flavobacteriales bacterium]MBT3740274.1 hypothetical protein [Flavobacteriales bacterium]MBT4102687.1 hypothetical protein [Flavobacteriales bacterium]
MRNRVVVAMGGYSSERGISLASGQFILDALSNTTFDCIALDLIPSADGSHDHWTATSSDGMALTVDWEGMLIDGKKPDVVLNMVHGSPGEDGWLSQHLDQLQIPHSSCRGPQAQLTFHKAKNNEVAKQHGAHIAPSLLVSSRDDASSLMPRLQNLQLPVFVKPARSGSSYGITRLTDWSDLSQALEVAGKEDDDILIEQGVSGVELACGIARLDGELRLLGLTEIVPESDFFDYRAKYEGAAQEITPARIVKQASDDIIAMTRSLYNDMQLKGLCRVDYILPASGKATLIEINSVPGMSPESIVPKQINASDMAMHEFLTLLIQQALTDG